MGTAASLPGPALETAPWARLAAALPRAPAEAAEDATFSRVQEARLRALVAEALTALSRRLDETLPGALARARQQWDQVDQLTIIDGPLGATLANARRWLGAAAADGGPRRSAVALEGLAAVEAATGLVELCERRLSALIRLRVRSQAEDLLPNGRPFLDVAAALAQAAEGWA